MTTETQLTRAQQIAARAAAAVERHGDQNEVVAGGSGTYTPPPAGKAKARLVGYFETGPQKNKNYPDKPAQNSFILQFALYGEGYTREDGKPMTIETRKFAVGRGEKSNAVKIFRQLCPTKDVQHFLGLLGRAFWVVIEHNTQPAKEAGKPDVVFANIKESELKPALRDVFDDDDNLIGQREVAVPEATDDQFKVFEWDVPSKEDFDTLPGKYQKIIRSSEGFAQSALFALVGAGNPATTDAPDEGPEPQDGEDEPQTQDTPQTPVTDTPVADAGALPSL